ncbi:MAG: glutamate racemase [Candidatus Roizmanbacteria bacterium]
MKIGIFDSGVGGLAILNKIVNRLPQYDYVYLGDNARVPYGNRSEHIVAQYVEEAVSFLFKEQSQLIILACNTATAVGLRPIQQVYLKNIYSDRRVLGVVRPAVETAVELGAKRIGIIGTTLTISSECFPKEIGKINPHIEVYQQACPLLVPMIEEGAIDREEIFHVLKRYLQPLIGKNIEAIILGCTHYELIELYIKEIVGQKVKVISEGEVVATKLDEYLKRHNEIENLLSKNSTREYYFTDLDDHYKKLAQYFLGSSYNVDSLFQEVYLP